MVQEFSFHLPLYITSSLVWQYSLDVLGESLRVSNIFNGLKNKIAENWTQLGGIFVVKFVLHKALERLPETSQPILVGVLHAFVEPDHLIFLIIHRQKVIHICYTCIESLGNLRKFHQWLTCKVRRLSMSHFYSLVGQSETLSGIVCFARANLLSFEIFHK